MKKIFSEDRFAILVEEQRKDKEFVGQFLSRCPFKIVLFNKRDEKLKNLSSTDRIDNANELRRVYGSVTYLIFPIRLVGNQLVITNSKGYKYGMALEDGVICLSKRFLKTEFHDLMKMKREEVMKFGYEMCKRFLRRHSSALLSGKCYDVVLMDGEETVQEIESVFADDTEALRTVIKENLKVSEPAFKTLIEGVTI